MSRARALRYRLWWAWAKFRIGSDALAAAGYLPPAQRQAKRLDATALPDR